MRGVLNGVRLLAILSGVAALSCKSVTDASGVRSVSVIPSVGSIAVGQSVQLTAVAVDGDGRVVTGKPVVWESGNIGILGVNDIGVVTGVSEGGPVVLYAVVDGGVGTADIEVTALPREMCTAAGATNLAPGTSLAGTITSSDCIHANGTRYDLWRFTLGGSSEVTIQMGADVLDTYLALYTVGGQLISENDDVDGGTDSRIVAALDAGTYLVQARAAVPEGLGNYTIVMGVGEK